MLDAAPRPPPDARPARPALPGRRPGADGPRAIQRRALLLTALSLALWGGWSALRPNRHPYGDLSHGQYTDHFSHVGSSRLFFRVGRDIWRRAIEENTRPLTPEELRRLPADVAGTSLPAERAVYALKGEPEARPIIATWPHVARYYPPGDALLFAPAAWLYERFDISFTQLNRLVLLLLLAYAHVTVFILLREWLGSPAPLGALGLVAAGFTYLETIHWTLEGFYDAAALGPLVLALGFWRQRRGLAALVSLAVAAFIHFRAYFYAPVAVLALLELWRTRAFRSFRGRDWAALAVGAALGGASLYSFVLCWPGLQAIGTRNAVHLKLGVVPAHPWLAALFLALSALGVLLFLRAGARDDGAIMGWMTLMFLRLPAAYRWYDLVPLPWLATQEAHPRRPDWPKGLKLLYAAWVTVYICQARLGLMWLKELF